MVNIMSGYGKYKDRQDWLRHEAPLFVPVNPMELSIEERKRCLKWYVRVYEMGQIPEKRLKELADMLQLSVKDIQE